MVWSEVEMKLGERSRELRKERHLTQRRLAAMVNIDFTYLSKIENERLEHTPSIKTIQGLAKALNVDEMELLELANKIPSGFEKIVRNKEALQFFRRATQTIDNPKLWKELMRYLEGINKE